MHYPLLQVTSGAHCSRVFVRESAFSYHGCTSEPSRTMVVVLFTPVNALHAFSNVDANTKKNEHV